MGEAGDWFQAHLSRRRLRVCTGMVKSPWLMPRFGVFQDSILGPLMFVLFANDLPKTVRHGSMNMTPPCTLKLKQLSRLWKHLVLMPNQHWVGTDNRLIVNLKKTHLMGFGRKHRKKEISEMKLVLSNVQLQPEQSVVYLGVTLDDQLKWDDVMKLRSECFGGLVKLRRN